MTYDDAVDTERDRLDKFWSEVLDAFKEAAEKPEGDDE